MPLFEPPRLQHFCDLIVELAQPMELGKGLAGQRRVIPITGGRASGARLNGKILNLGADWQTIFADGTALLDTRYSIQAEDGALIEIINRGFRHGPESVMSRVASGEQVDPCEYYMRTVANLETGDNSYRWINNKLFVGTGGRFKAEVHVSLYEVC